MITITYKQLYDIIEIDAQINANEIDYSDYVTERPNNCVKPSVFEALKKCDIKKIIADSNMSEHNLGGDDLCNLAHDILRATADGYTIAVWYGPDSEALIIGYHPTEMTIMCTEEEMAAQDGLDGNADHYGEYDNRDDDQY